MVVKNEDRFIWYAISSVIKYVDTLLIADTGSTDDTVKVIRSFKNKKIKFSEHSIKTPFDISKIRQNQIESTSTDWFWIVDGDEIYSEALISEIINIINHEKNHFEGIVVRRHDLLGDIYHYQDNTAGYYQMLGEKGHFALRLINKSKTSVHLEGVYPYEGYYDQDGKEIINHPRNNFYFTKGFLHHAMYLKRSSIAANLKDTSNRQKFKYENGLKLDLDKIPDIFFSRKPGFVSNVSEKRSLFYNLISSVLTPLKKFKRNLI